MPDDFQIPDDPESGKMDAAYLRTFCGLRPKDGETPPELPIAVRRAYYAMAHALSRLGARNNSMDPTQLATVFSMAMLEQAEDDSEIEDDATVAAAQFPASEAVLGQKVVIHWRKRDRPAHFLGTNGDRIVVLHEGNEVNMRADLVRFAQEDEFPSVANNINKQFVEV
jgi:hypothetical protein